MELICNNAWYMYGVDVRCVSLKRLDAIFRNAVPDFVVASRNGVCEQKIFSCCHLIFDELKTLSHRAGSNPATLWTRKVIE
jgi:hypothetical protein